MREARAHPLHRIKHQQVPTPTGSLRPAPAVCLTPHDVCGEGLPGLSLSPEVKEEDMPQARRLNKYLTLFSERGVKRPVWRADESLCGKDKRDRTHTHTIEDSGGHLRAPGHRRTSRGGMRRRPPSRSLPPNRAAEAWILPGRWNSQ